MAKIKWDPRLMELAKQFLEIYEPTSTGDVYDGLKEMLGGTIESMLEAEMDDHLGYPKGVSADHPENIRNGFSISASQITAITDKIIPMINEWQSRPLESVYPVVFLDASITI